MTTIELRFPAGRYHATPWGRHVNEGAAEWPPSPYRLIRALYDAWKRKCAHLPEAAVEPVLVKLASEPPVFRLPQASASHTRSYLHNNTMDDRDKSLVFDAFVAVSRDASCFVEFPVDVTAEQRAVLGELTEGLNYLGRSESWVIGRIFEGEGAGPIVVAPGIPARREDEGVRVACAVPFQEFDGENWMQALTYTSTQMLKDRRSGPPAMRNVGYVRPRSAVASWLPERESRMAQTVSGVELGLHARVLPLATETVRWAELIRDALMSRLGDEGCSQSPVITGKEPDGTPLKGHSHLFVLPQADEFGRINRILLYARGGFSSLELAAIMKLRTLRRFEDSPVRAAVTWSGGHDDADFRPRGKEFVSCTPFATARHWRPGRGTVEDFIVAELRRECANHGLPEPVSVEVAEKLASPFQRVHFRLYRKGQKPEPSYAFRLRFAEDVSAPFSLGFNCHFGAGQFALATV